MKYKNPTNTTLSENTDDLAEKLDDLSCKLTQLDKKIDSFHNSKSTKQEIRQISWIFSQN